MEIRKARDAEAKDSGVVAGPPGTGKSTLCGTIMEVEEVEPTLLVATLPREIKSWKYQQHNVDYLLIHDKDWKPSQNQLWADGCKRFNEAMAQLKEDEQYGNIIIDSGTELAEMVWHYAMLPHGCAAPSQMDDKKSRWLPYETLDIHMTESVLAAVALTIPDLCKRPKNVFFTWHVRAAREDEAPTSKGGPVRASADLNAQDIEYEGKILPQVRGQFRRRLMQYVSWFVYTDRILVSKNPQDPMCSDKVVKYVLQVQTDYERHCKVPGPAPEIKYIPNHYSELRKFLRHQYELEQEAAAQPKPQDEQKAAKKAAPLGGVKKAKEPLEL